MKMNVLPENLLIPNALERRQIFHLLKKNSSWTAWNRILGYYKAWAEITENSVREADNAGLLVQEIDQKTGDYIISPKSSIVYSSYVGILEGLALFDEGVTRLRKGDKRVFTYSEANGFFARASLKPSHWQTMKHRIDEGETRWKKETPYTKEFFEALYKLNKALKECAHSNPGVLEERDLEATAHMDYGLWTAVFLSRLPYPDSLPEVPEPEKEVIVKTGHYVPHSGIWEPVRGETEKGWLIKTPQPPFHIIGAMNYLHGGTKALKADLTHLDPDRADYGFRYFETDVVWRLIWRDTRYEDGTIPEEEKDYRFVCPVPEGEEDPYDQVPSEYIKKHKLPHPFLSRPRSPAEEPPADPAKNRCPGGEVCPQDGMWWTPADDKPARPFKKGDIMPNYPNSSYGATFWYREDKNK